MRKIEIKNKLKGLTGLTNLGNTCYINSCIQILSHTHELNMVLNHNYKKKINHEKIHDYTILIEWDNLRKLMWSQNCIISPGRFIKQLQTISIHKNREEFSDFSQNDSSEFFLFLIDCFHTSIAREVNVDISGTPKNDKDNLAIICFNKMKEIFKTEYSEIFEIFYGLQISQIISLEPDTHGNIINNTPEQFMILNLPIPNIKLPSLLDCLNLYVEGEILEGENSWYNEKTQLKQSIQKKLIFWSLPKILVIDIKRFNPINFNKNQIFISFPLTELDLNDYTIGYQNNNIYDLYAIINHHGITHGGHYYSFIKNENKWFCFNDTNVSEITDLNQLFTPFAYCFFYRRRN
jgi:ubiquitin C-terminal hydrolase